MKITFRMHGSIRLTERDFELFQYLETNSPKTATEISREFWKDKSDMSHAGQKRILRLASFGLLERGNPQLLHLSEFGRCVLSQKRNKEQEGRNKGEAAT